MPRCLQEPAQSSIRPTALGALPITSLRRAEIRKLDCNGWLLRKPHLHTSWRQIRSQSIPMSLKAGAKLSTLRRVCRDAGRSARGEPDGKRSSYHGRACSCSGQMTTSLPKLGLRLGIGYRAFHRAVRCPRWKTNAGGVADAYNSSDFGLLLLAVPRPNLAVPLILVEAED